MTATPAPATDHVPWRGSALLVGGLATATWSCLLLLVLVRGTDGASSFTGAVLALAGLALSFGANYLLRKMWAGPAYRGGPVLGRRLAAAFEVLISLAIILSVWRGGAVQVMLAWTAVLCFLAAFVLAIPRPVPPDE